MDLYSFCGSLKNGQLAYMGKSENIMDELDGIFSIEKMGKPMPEKNRLIGSAICLGDFDGLHRGHIALLGMTEEYDRRGVLIFNRNAKNKPELTVLSEKVELLEKMGMTYAIIADFTSEFAKGTETEFVDFLRYDVGASMVAAGYDYRFGHQRTGDACSLLFQCESRGMDVNILNAVRYRNEPIKSTNIRNMIQNGDLKRAANLLGRYYTVSGRVVRGLRNGRKLEAPTANIAVSSRKILPPDGVYYGRVNGRSAVINIGKNPTFGAEKRTFEVHIPNYSGDLYGVRLETELLEKIRDEKKFENRDELMFQIKEDIKSAKERARKYGKENTN